MKVPMAVIRFMVEFWWVKSAISQRKEKEVGIFLKIIRERIRKVREKPPVERTRRL